MIHQPHDVLDHFHAVLAGVVRFVASPMPPIIQGNGPVLLGQLGQDLRGYPIRRNRRSQTRHENNRRPFALLVVVNADTTRVEVLALDVQRLELE